jgi:hypothetical protein
MPTAAIAAPVSSEPPIGRPVPAAAADTSAPAARFAMPASSSAATSGARRPTRAERISSARPVSSSARVCRPTRNMLISATTMARNEKISNTTSPPIESSSRVGPLIAITAVLLPIVCRSRTRSSGVSYRLWLCVDCTTMSSAAPASHHGSVARSRRRRNRSSFPVPVI